MPCADQGFDRWQFLKKKFKKNSKIQKKFKKPEAACGKVLNCVCENLTEGTTLMHITNLGTKLRQT